MKNSMGELASFTTRAGCVYGGFAISVTYTYLQAGLLACLLIKSLYLEPLCIEARWSRS